MDSTLHFMKLSSRLSRELRRSSSRKFLIKRYNLSKNLFDLNLNLISRRIYYIFEYFHLNKLIIIVIRTVNITLSSAK